MNGRRLTGRLMTGAMTGFLASMIMGLDQQMDEISFETLFPQTWYAKALAAVTHVWGDFDALASSDIKPNEKKWIMDSSMGRMAFCAYALTHLYEGKPTPVSDDELSHLNRAIKAVELRTEQLKNFEDQDRLHCLQRMISGVKKRVKYLLQANDSRASTS